MSASCRVAGPSQMTCCPPTCRHVAKMSRDMSATWAVSRLARDDIGRHLSRRTSFALASQMSRRKICRHVTKIDSQSRRRRHCDVGRFQPTLSASRRHVETCRRHFQLSWWKLPICSNCGMPMLSCSSNGGDSIIFWFLWCLWCSLSPNTLITNSLKIPVLLVRKGKHIECSSLTPH
jgi:hypothetical protein